MADRVNAIEVRGPEMAAIGEAARRAGIGVMPGLAERDRGSICCARALIDDRGEVVMSRRKLRPTRMERTAWGEGPVTDFTVPDTPTGRVRGLCCGENIQPANRQGTHQLGEQIYNTCWPFFDRFKGVRQAHALSAEANIVDCRSHALRAGCFVLAANSFITQEGSEAIPMGDARLRQMATAGGGEATA